MEGKQKSWRAGVLASRNRKWGITAALLLAPRVVIGGVNTWIATDDGNASDGKNWSLGRVPLATDEILLDGSARGNLAWDATPENGLPVTVAAWTQKEGYTGVVQFNTTYDETLFPVFTIAGNAVVENGTWTHHANFDTAEWRLKIRVNGNMVFGANASIDLRQRGFRPWNGPGFGGKGDWGGGSAMAGEASGGFWNPDDYQLKTYGLVRAPFLIGSGTEYEPGAGAVWLEVAGHLELDGSIVADGTANQREGHGGTSGGAVYVKAGTLSGNGRISANGESHGNGCGGGGRIALVSASPLPGNLECRATGRTGARASLTGAGTIFYGADDLRGIVLVDNPPFEQTRLSTHLPANRVEDQNENLRFTDWVVSRHGKLKLQAGVAINSLTLDGENAQLDLNGHELMLYALDVNGTAYTNGLYTADALGAQQIFGAGRVNLGGFSIVTNGPPRMDGTNIVLPCDVLSAHGSTTLILYYGPSDKKTDADAWAHCVVLDEEASAGPFTHAVPAPEGGGILVYRYAVSNETGVTWSPWSSSMFMRAPPEK